MKMSDVIYAKSDEATNGNTWDEKYTRGHHKYLHNRAAVKKKEYQRVVKLLKEAIELLRESRPSLNVCHKDEHWEWERRKDDLLRVALLDGEDNG